MRIPIERHSVRINPDSKRVIARFFFNGEERCREVIKQVMKLNEEEVFGVISPILQEYSKRHRNITKILERHFEQVKWAVEGNGMDVEKISTLRKLLIGSYFTHEYSIESAAFFNPSIVEDPDQSELEDGQKRIIMSFRAVGEGHISSIAFRRALIGRDNKIRVMPVGNYDGEAEIVRNTSYEKQLFLEKAYAAKIDVNVLKEVEGKIDDTFEYAHLRKIVLDSQKLEEDDVKKLHYEKLMWLLDTYHDISFSLDTDISDRVIFTISELEGHALEVARFVMFTEENGEITYYAT